MRDADKIKDKLDIVELVGEYVDLKKSGRNFKGLCPFHTEKSPSFFVSDDRQTWHCFGACDEGGDGISFYMKAENTTFPEALKELAKRVGVILTSSFEHDRSWQEKNRLYEINHLASEYYHYVLTKHKIGKEAQEYLKNRNISQKIIKTFLIGYAPTGWRNLLPFLKKKGYTEIEIEKAGLVIKGRSGYYDRFRGRVIFTLKDHRGNIVGFSGRVLDKRAKEAKYINSPETDLYHKSNILYGLDITQNSIRDTDTAIICEGEFDVLSSFQHGISNIVAIKGTALTRKQLTILKRYTRNILLALDMDVAGNQAAHRSIELAENLDFNIKVIYITNGKDLDEGVQNNVVKVKRAIKNAPSVYDYILTSALRRNPESDSVDKKRIVSEVIPFYTKIQNSIVRDFFVKKLSQTIDISVDAVLEQMSKEQNKKKLTSSTMVSPTKTAHKNKSRQQRLEEYLLTLIVQSGNPDVYLKKLAKTITISLLETPAISRIVSLLLSKDKIPSELSELYNRCHLSDIQSVLSDTRRFNSEFKETVNNIQKGMLRKKLKDLAKRLKTSSESHGELNDQFKKISSQLKKLESNERPK